MLQGLSKDNKMEPARIADSSVLTIDHGVAIAQQ